MYISYQDFAEESNKADFIKKFINYHEGTDLVRTAYEADEYDAQRNLTIMNYSRVYYTMLGEKKVDWTASNNKITSNFFNRLNTQRVTYSLGNGVTFTNGDQDFDSDSIKKRFGKKFDQRIKEAGMYACEHGISFVFFNLDQVHVFPITQFAPLWDEETGALRAGIRYWQIDTEKPMIAVLYEEDGYTKYKSKDGKADFTEIQPKRAYKQRRVTSVIDGTSEVVGESNYGSLPIVPMYANRQHQSTLVGMRSSIDSYDLIRSGFANDLTDCADVYWIISNADGMSDEELVEFRDKLKLQKIAKADEGQVSTATVQIPTEARSKYLEMIKAGIYEDFGALDVHTIAAGATNDHIDAAYQPMDENADDFEYFVAECILQLLALIGEEDVDPVFKRNRISNQKELTDMIMECANILDEQTILELLPFVSPDKVKEIMEKKEAEAIEQFEAEPEEEQEEDQEEQEEPEVE